MIIRAARDLSHDSRALPFRIAAPRHGRRPRGARLERRPERLAGVRNDHHYGRVAGVERDSACLGSLAGIGGPAAIVWFDAHRDRNTPETTETGYFDGMALATTLGWCWTNLARQIPGFAAAEERDVLAVCRSRGSERRSATFARTMRLPAWV